VQATRARQGTEWFIARDELGTDGQDADRITRLAWHMRTSRAQMPTLEYREIDPHQPDRHLGRFPGISIPRLLRPPDHDRGHDHGR
jgi:hypothetical protein